jgi:hypothetical protein
MIYSQSSIDADEQTALTRPRCLCQQCSELRSLTIPLSVQRKTNKRGDETHASWGWSAVHWEERNPEDPHWQILISCHSCKHDRYTPKASIKNPNWHGLCPECVERFGIPGKRRTLIGLHLNPFGALIDYDEQPHAIGRAWVYCPNFFTCRGKAQKRVDAHNQDKQPLLCQGCGFSDKSSRLTKAWSGKSGAATSNPLLKKMETRTQWLLDAVDRVVAFWDEMQSLDLSHDEKLDRVTQLRLAALLSIGEKGSKSSAVQLAARLGECNVREAFSDSSRGSSSWFRAFITLVVEEHERGMAVRDIAALIKLRAITTVLSCELTQ